MKIENIKIRNDGYILCKSNFYSAYTGVDEIESYEFSSGINILKGDIDSGNWAISYLLSMYKYDSKKNVLFEPLTAMVNGENMELKELWKYTCYLDTSYPLFSTKKKVSQLVSRGIKKNSMQKTAEEIRDIFHLDKERFERPLSGVGNERYRAMAAIGYANAKQVFCLPWLSKGRFDCFHYHMVDLFEVLDSLGKMVIVPVGKD